MGSPYDPERMADRLIETEKVLATTTTDRQAAIILARRWQVARHVPHRYIRAANRLVALRAQDRDPEGARQELIRRLEHCYQLAVECKPRQAAAIAERLAIYRGALRPDRAGGTTVQVAVLPGEGGARAMARLHGERPALAAELADPPPSIESRDSE